jgi:plastocyanin
MLRIVLVFVLFLAITVIGAVVFSISSENATAQTTTTVDVGDFYFCNASFSGNVCDRNISVGDTVTWQWVGSATHTVTQCDPTFTTCPPPGGFASPAMSTGTFSQTFNTAGSFEYRCDFHPTQMRGRINVAAQQATPTATAGPTTAGSTPSPGQTGAPGQTGSPTPVRSAAPAVVPQSGGPPADGGTPWALLVAAASGVALIIGGGVLGLRVRRH